LKRLSRRCVALAAACLACIGLCASPSFAQPVYRNIVNARFRTVSNGPLSAHIVDVKDPNNDTEVRQQIVQTLGPRLRIRNANLRPGLTTLQRLGILKPGQEFDIVDTVLVRSNGKLPIPPKNERKRGPGDELTFVIATGNQQGAFPAQEALELQQIINLIYPDMRDNILGRPGWTGTVTVRNLDPRLGKTDEVVGALLVVTQNNVEIWFPTFRAYETRFLAAAQTIAQAFHARSRIAYDAWEVGMARAAAVVAALRLRSRIPANQTVDPANGFYFTPFYDLLNQPALGNDTFFPPTKTEQPINPTTLAGMLVPRLQMAATAWLKCYIENPNFFKRFNTGADNGLGTSGFYAAFANDPNIANDVNRLRALARAALANVELLPFDDWFERQYALDTSITQGPKLYVYSQPTFPQDGTDSGGSFFVIYYRTFLTNGKGDELDLSGNSNVVYWDFNFSSRLFLPGFDTVRIVNGFGAVSPFFTNIGGNPADTMRVAVDFPVNKEYVRVYFPAGRTGTAAVPNDFSGVTIGSDSGTLSVNFEGGTGPITTPIQQGSFGARGILGAVQEAFSRTQITYTPPQGNPITFQRNTFQRSGPGTTALPGVNPVFVLAVPGPVSTLNHTFPAGPNMISLPIRPLTSDLARVLGSNPNATLLAQYRQDLPGDDKYLRYPTLPLYQPGYALWSNFTTPLNATAIRGERTDILDFVNVSAPFGWTQIATPYPTPLNVTTDLQFQYLGGDAVSYAEAITRGWIAAGIVGFSQTAGYQDITTTNDPNFPRNLLEPWKGYWIRVRVTDGLTITYIQPRSRSAHTRSEPLPILADGWRVPLVLRDAVGNRSEALLGQASQGSDTFNPALHIASPPPFTRAPTLAVRFPHTEWDAGTGGKGGDFLTDIRPLGRRSEWNVMVTVPQAEQSYTLSWQDVARVPRGTRLTLVDLDSGVRQLMNSTSNYTFRAGRDALTRRFQIIAEPRGAGRLQISNVAARSGGLRSAQSMVISYEVSGAAETTVEVFLGGQRVRMLGRTRSVPSGPQELVWDTRDDVGRALPAGLYQLRITARTEEGEQTRSITPLLLTR
jgi:hypothetical protein